ncbi:hypothetical protein NHX12_033739 [Muraenolepis orangiensis]|uniref:Iodothyronine deiodinase n=1 Tax=Muraenolepis orangiensis TaxID=630683 RepID=A0A9Q0II90_9TELE|nr:hypothetical protein NHX12_033739 [Muraenolepis orangiensis]
MAKNLMLKIGEKATMTQNPKFKFEDWGFSFTSFAFIKSIYDNLWLSLGQEAFVGCDAPDSQVVNMEGKQSTLLKYLNDGWAFSNNLNIQQHQTLGDRLSAAQILVDLEPRCPVVVDDMSNVASGKYGALPERLYILQAGKVVYKVRELRHHEDTCL